MEKLKQYKYIILIIVLILGFAFYWYEYQPAHIKERCSAEAHLDRRAVSTTNSNLRQEFINNYYDDCLMRFGLK